MLEGDEHQGELHGIMLWITKNEHFDQSLSKSDRADSVIDFLMYGQEEEMGDELSHQENL